MVIIQCACVVRACVRACMRAYVFVHAFVYAYMPVCVLVSMCGWACIIR